MKKITFFTLALSIGLSVTSCDEPNFEQDEPTIPQCDYSSYEEIQMGDFGLKIPEEMSYGFKIAFNSRDVLYNLNTVLETQGNFGYTTDLRAMIKFNLVSDGQTCKGDESDTYYKGNENVLISSVKIPKPSNAAFYGSVTITIRTDDFNEDVENYPGYYVRWTATDNDGNNWADDGNLLGEKFPIDYDGEQMVYIPRDEPIYNDGRNQLVPYDEIDNEPLY